MIVALCTLVKAIARKVYSLWCLCQPALHQKISLVWEQSLLGSFERSHTRELNEYSNYIAAIYDEVHRFCAAIYNKHYYPTLLQQDKLYTVQLVEFQSNELWYYCVERSTPFAHATFHHPVDMVWHMLLTSMGEPRHPYFANCTS